MADPSFGHLTPAAGVAIFDSTGRILLGRHRHDGKWATFGGAVEPGESVEQAARREVGEEVRIELSELRCIGVFEGDSIYDVTYDDGSVVSYSVTMFATVVEEMARPLPDGDEIVEARWFAPAEIETRLLARDMLEIVPTALEWHLHTNVELR
jgi:8-oxo-dGTP pyrophosphatase MutT (NUDIX family)